MKNIRRYSSYLWMEFNCLKGAEPLRVDSLLFTTHSPGGLGNHLINFDWMKG